MTVEQLKAQRKQKKIQFNRYAERRNALKTILSRIDDRLDDDISDVNKQITKCSEELEKGIKGHSKVATLRNSILGAKEKYASSDSKISSCRDYIDTERSRCQGRINSLDGEIRDLETRIKEQGGTIYFWE